MKALNLSWNQSSSKEESILLQDTPAQSEILSFSNDLPEPIIVEERSSSWKSVRRITWLFQGWRYGIAMCSLLAAATFIVNISILAWSASSFTTRGGAASVFKGDCGHAKNLSTWLHLAINILSTGLLGSSNYCMQCLTSPTREAIDKAHSKRKWLNVGVPNFKNLRYVGWKRAALWFILAASSVPLHLLWNSAVFEELAANTYFASLVTEDWVHGGDFSISAYQIELHEMQQNIKNLVNLTNTECIHRYSSSPFISDLGNVVLVSHDHNTTNSWLIDSWNIPSAGGVAYRWICSPEHLDKHGNCDPSLELKDPYAWTPFDPPFNGGNENTKRGNATVKYCLAERTNPSCHLGVSPPILAVVAVCNLIKLLAFLCTLCLGTDTPDRTKPLVTTGDAIASFLQTPDPHTQGRVLLTKRLVQKSPHLAFHSPSHPSHPLRQHSNQPRWFTSASPIRWAAVLFPSALLILIPILLLTRFSYPIHNTPSLLTSSGFGRPRPDLLVLSDNQRSLPSASLLANTPQLLLSYTYLAYNGLFTVMLASAEYTSFATTRRGLRVTAPKPGSDQRSRYYLHLPYRYGIPLLCGSALLHWLVSQSIFLIRVTIYDVQGAVDPASALSAVGYSPLAIIVSVSVGAVFIIAVLVLGTFRRYSGMMPAPGGCSAVVASACHLVGEEKGDGESVAEKKVMFGVTGVYCDDEDDAGERIGQDLAEEGVVMHASFSAGEVTKLETGSWYA